MFNPEQYTEYMQYVKISTLEIYQSADKLDGEQLDSLISGLNSQFIASPEGAVTASDTPQSAAVRFAKWLEKYVVVASLEVKKISVQLTRNYGQVSVTFGMDAETSDLSPAQFDAAYAHVYNSVQQQFKRWEAQELSNLAVQSAADQKNTQPVTDYDEFPADRISVESRNGKTYYRVHGGRWQKFGVMIWEEALSKAGMSGATIPVDGMPLTGYRAKALMQGGKPTKIVELVKS